MPNTDENPLRESADKITFSPVGDNKRINLSNPTNTNSGVRVSVSNLSTSQRSRRSRMSVPPGSVVD